jgi:hypothetical protein
MIHFVVPREGAFGIENYLTRRGQRVAARINVLLYEDLRSMERLEIGTYLFSALDQLTDSERQLVAGLWDALAAHGCRLLNDPRRALCRAELLERMFDSGVNRFRACRATDSLEALRFPVFVRESNQHSGSLTGLLRSRRDVDRSLLSLALRGYRRSDLLVVEFLDTCDGDGFYRKYTAFRVGEYVMPKGLEYGRDWVLKHQTSDRAAHPLEEEIAYVESNPFGPWLRRVFELSGIEYGRIDFGVWQGEPQVWEINTNPTIAGGPRPRKRSPEEEEYRRVVAGSRERFYSRFERAWLELDPGDRLDRSQISVSFPEPLVRRISTEHRRRERRRLGRTAAFALATKPGVRILRRVIEFALLRLAPGLARVSRPRTGRSRRVRS